MANNFFKTPWATTGEKVEIPDATQPSGDVSLEEGYTDDYSKDSRVEPTSKFIERSKWNWLFGKVTAAIRELQVFGGIPEFITSVENGDAPFSYSKGARCVLSGVIYVSLNDANVTTPPDATWGIVDKITGVPVETIENVDISATAQIDASKINTGDVSNAEFNYLDGVTSDIQTQLNAKQATGDYITELTGDVTAIGAGSVGATLSATGAVAGTYTNAQVQVDAKGRVTSIEDGPTPITLQEGFETFNAGLPDTLAWSSADTAKIAQSALHVTQGSFSCSFNTATAMAMEATGVDLSFMGEVVVDVYIGSITGVASLKVGTTTVSTPTDTVGVFTLRCPVTDGDTTIELSTSGACQCWWDNMRSLLMPSIPNDYIDLEMMAGGTAGNMYIMDAVGNPALMPTGTTGQVATSNGPGVAPTMQDAGGALVGTKVFAENETMATHLIANGYLALNGATFNALTYPLLNTALGTNVLMDTRGEFLRGNDDGRGIDSGRVLGSSQLDDYKSHAHNARGHGGTAVLFNVSNSFATGGSSFSNNGVTQRSGLVSAAGGTETRPRSMAIRWFIKGD